jgi:hypothetical protein
MKSLSIRRENHRHLHKVPCIKEGLDNSDAVDELRTLLNIMGMVDEHPVWVLLGIGQIDFILFLLSVERRLNGGPARHDGCCWFL